MLELELQFTQSQTEKALQLFSTQYQLKRIIDFSLTAADGQLNFKAKIQFRSLLDLWRVSEEWTKMNAVVEKKKVRKYYNRKKKG